MFCQNTTHTTLLYYRFVKVYALTLKTDLSKLQPDQLQGFVGHL